MVDIVKRGVKRKRDAHQKPVRMFCSNVHYLAKEKNSLTTDYRKTPRRSYAQNSLVAAQFPFKISKAWQDLIENVASWRKRSNEGKQEGQDIWNSEGCEEIEGCYVSPSYLLLLSQYSKKEDLKFSTLTPASSFHVETAEMKVILKSLSCSLTASRCVTQNLSTLNQDLMNKVCITAYRPWKRSSQVSSLQNQKARSVIQKRRYPASCFFRVVTSIEQQ